MSSHRRTAKGVPLRDAKDAVWNKIAQRDYPVLFGAYRKIHGASHIGRFSAPKWLLVGGTQQEIDAIKAKAQPGPALDNEGNVILTPQQRDWALDMGMLTIADVDPEASIGVGSGLIIGRTRKENPDELTKNERIVLGFNERGLCKIHGGSVSGFYTVNGGKLFRLRDEQMHVPSRAALADAKLPVDREHIYFGCHICNKAMGDGLGLMSVEEARPIILADLRARGVRFYAPEEIESRTEDVMTTRTIYSLRMP